MRRCEIEVPQWAQTGEPVALTVRGLIMAEVSLGVVNIRSIRIGVRRLGKRGVFLFIFVHYQLVIRPMKKKHVTTHMTSKLTTHRAAQVVVHSFIINNQHITLCGLGFARADTAHPQLSCGAIG